MLTESGMKKIKRRAKDDEVHFDIQSNPTAPGYTQLKLWNGNRQLSAVLDLEQIENLYKMLRKSAEQYLD
jgi:hypothetical protein